MAETAGRKGKRGVTIYESNPFVKNAAANARVGTKRIAARDGQRFMIVSEHGEVLAPAGFHEVVEVDRTAFLKLYVNGIKAFAGLKPAGARVFEVIYNLVSQLPGADRVWVHYADVDMATNPMSERTFMRGMRELIELGFIAESSRPSMYWLNIDYLFNGDRLAFIKEYRMTKARPERRQQSSDESQRIELEAHGQRRLPMPKD